jgi:hypothetical protein
MVLLDTTIPASAYDGVVNSLAKSYNTKITNEWREAPRGFICEGVSSTDAEHLASDPRVRVVEEDFQFSVSTSGMQWTGWNNNYLWHLDRLDEPTYATHDSQYDMCPEAREITAYIVDIGVRADHEQFTRNEPAGRVESYTFDDGSTTGYTDQTNGCTSGSPNYNRWHGTAVASLIGGTTTGAAKVHIVSLRVADCGGGGLASWVVNAIRWIRSASDPKSSTLGVVSMSTFFGDWQTNFVTLSDTVDARVKATGIPFFVSANNFSADACKFTPANLAYTNINRLTYRANPTLAGGTVFSVGGTSLGANGDTNDYRWQTWDSGLAAIGQDTGSNGGSCVSIYAPAADIYAARTTSTTAYDVASGTSFSAPLTAAIAARYISSTGVSTYQDVYDYLLSVAGSSSLINNVSTPEYWMCQQGYPSFAYVGYRTNPGVCPAGQTGVNGTSTPIHFNATSNTSNAGMLYSPMSCP